MIVIVLIAAVLFFQLWSYFDVKGLETYPLVVVSNGYFLTT